MRIYTTIDVLWKKFP